MFAWFFFSVMGIIGILPLYFSSLEHKKLENKYGREKGKKLGEMYGRISGWFFFLCWFGIWISPQPRFVIPIFSKAVALPANGLAIPTLHLIMAMPIIIASLFFGILGVKSISLKVAETHRAERIVTGGLYSLVRHPQYLGGLLAHAGITLLFSALYSLIAFPFIIVLVCIISRKEEKELINEFGEEYENYRRVVPMMIPRFRKNEAVINS